MHEHDDLLLTEAKGGQIQDQNEGVDRATQAALASRRLDALGPQGITALQRSAGNAGVTGLVEDDAGDSVRDTIGSGGRALDDDTRSSMEAQIGADFSSVRLHTGATAQRSTEAVAARAYTVGENVVLGNSVDPSSDSGQRTLAHELTHVVQQRQGPVDGTETDSGVKVSDPDDRFEREAEETADAVMSGSGPGVQMQRQGEEEEELQMQREGMDEEELQMQREGMEEEELQMQREGMEEEELQMQREGMDEEELQMQREGMDEEEELQMQRQGEEEEELQMQREALDEPASSMS